jgi:hypothetical protein
MEKSGDETEKITAKYNNVVEIFKIFYTFVRAALEILEK